MVRKIISIVLSVLLVCTVCFAFTTTYLERNKSGGWSSVCALTDKDKEWIEKNYAQYETIEELLYAINEDICTEYTYVDKSYFLGMQYFNLSGFIQSKVGLCFDFACYTKCVVLYMSEVKGWNAKVYVADLRTPKGAHSYNFITYVDDTGDEIRYYTDMTNNLYRYNNNKEFTTFSSIGELSFEEYASRYNERIFNYH